MSDARDEPLPFGVIPDEPLAKAFEIIIAGHDVDGSTKQPGPGSTTPDDMIPPPIPLEHLAALSTVSGTRGSCIEAVARNTVGLGVTAVPRTEGGTPPDGFASKVDELLKLLDALSRRDKRLDRPAFLDLLFAVKTDEEECGQGFIEVSRNVTTGKIDGIFHAPGKRMRRKRDRSGWRMLADAWDGSVGSGGLSSDTTTAVDFYNFGEKQAYDKETGELTADLATDKNTDVNEVIVFRLYSSESRDYGMPRDAAIALEYAAERLAAESNVSFFDSSGVPPTIIFVSGDQKSADGQPISLRVPQETVQRIAATVKSDAGHTKTVAVVPLPAGTDVNSVVLGKRSDRDIGNVEFRRAISQRIRSAFRLGAIFVADEDTGGRFDAEVQRALGLEQVFDPEQRRYEGLLDILIDELGYEEMRLSFKRLAVESDEARRTSANDASQVRAITNREYRKAHGFGPLPESDTEDEVKAAAEGKVVKGWNDRLVDKAGPTGGAGAALGGAGPVGDARPFGGRNGSDPMARKDNTGLQPGVGGRRATAAPAGTCPPAAVIKGHGDDEIDFESTELEVAYIDVTDGAIDRAMTRTHTIAGVLAGEVVAALERAGAAS